jgi:protein-disulfide isomerase/uncharacterized membrane protein
MQDVEQESEATINKESTPWALLLLIMAPIVGATLAFILADIHIQNQIGHLTEGALCGPDDGCNALATGPYSRFINVPLAFWGLAFALGTLVLALGLRHEKSSRAWLLKIIRRLAVSALICDCVLAYIMVVVEQSLCFYCVGSYCVHLTMVLCSGRAKKYVDKARTAPQSFDYAVFLGALGIGTLCLLFGLGFSHYLDMARKKRVQMYLSQVSKPANLEAVRGKFLGSKNARLTMTIFHDYRCVHCARLRRKVRLLLKRYPKELRLRFVNFPFDKSCNPKSSRKTGACQLAKASLLAESANKLAAFLALTDSGAVKNPEDLSIVLKQLAIEPRDMTAEAVRERLNFDIALSQKVKIRQLPTFFINGYRFEGVPSIAGFEQIFKVIQNKGS